MKIDLQSIDRTQFMVHEHFVGGEVVYLVQPQQMGCNWTQQNKIFRSSVWNSEGELVSASFPKFVNWGEKPEVFPLPTSLKGCVIPQKLDGSTLILSKYKGNYIIRTRGTLDASLMEKNGFEIELFKEKILSKLANDEETWPYSIIFEWVSPLNRVVILYPEADWYLIGFVDHLNYSLAEQAHLDIMAKKYDLKRPALYGFDQSFEEMIADVEKWRGVEGICVYSNNGQEIHKVKGLDYLVRHRLKSELSSFEKLIDFWISVGMPANYASFENEVFKLTDWETVMEHRGNISKIIDANKEVQMILKGMTEFLFSIKFLPNRKEMALKIISSYGQTGRSAMLFKLLDGKPLDKDDYKKLIFQVLK